jgi:hypothetical protein
MYLFIIANIICLGFATWAYHFTKSNPMLTPLKEAIATYILSFLLFGFIIGVITSGIVDYNTRVYTDSTKHSLLQMNGQYVVIKGDKVCVTYIDTKNEPAVIIVDKIYDSQGVAPYLQIDHYVANTHWAYGGKDHTYKYKVVLPDYVALPILATQFKKN